MTTLPQTTPVRVPRPGGAAPLAAPQGPAPVGAAAVANITGADIWRALRANLWLILLLSVVAGVVGYFLYDYFDRTRPEYTAQGLMMITSTSVANPLDPSPPPMDVRIMEIEQATQAILIRQDGLINRFLGRDKVQQTGWFSQFKTAGGVDLRGARESLLKGLSVSPQQNSKVIVVRMTASSPQDCKVIVEELITEHIETQQNRRKSELSDRSKNLSTRKQELETKSIEFARELRLKAEALTIDGTGKSGRIESLFAQVIALSQSQLLANEELAKRKARYEQIVVPIEKGLTPEAIVEMVENDPTLFSRQQQLEQYDTLINEQLLKVDQAHPSIKILRERRQLAEQSMEMRKLERTDRLKATLRETTTTEFRVAEAQMEAIKSALTSSNRQIGELGNAMAEHERLRRDLAEIQVQTKEVDLQLDNTKLLMNQTETMGVMWAARPEVPQVKTWPQRTQILSLSIACGLGLGLAIALLRELLDNSVRSPRDISRVGQMTLLGMIPHEDDDPQSSGARLPLVIFEAPQSILAEELRKVRTKMQHSASLDTTRSLLVTSPGPGDGKTTIAVNLAAGLALNGRRILLVDANFRRPELHRLFNMGNDIGFGDVLNDIESFGRAVQQSSVPNLSVLTSGPKPANPTELLESQLLNDFIERALEEFDHVVFDAGPILFASETVALAPRVDGVISVVRARTNSRGVLQRMRDQLRTLKAEHLGVVLNAVRTQGGGYYARNIKTYYAYQNTVGR